MADRVITFSLYINHGGKLYDYGGHFPFYDCGKITAKHGLDADKFGYSDLCEEVSKLGYIRFDRIGYKILGRVEKVKYLTDDATVMQMLRYVKEGDMMIALYVVGGIKKGSSSDDGSEDD